MASRKVFAAATVVTVSLAVLYMAAPRVLSARPQWTKVCDGEFFAALATPSAIVYVPALSRLVPATEAAANGESDGRVTVSPDGGIGLVQPARPGEAETKGVAASWGSPFEVALPLAANPGRRQLLNEYLPALDVWRVETTVGDRVLGQFSNRVSYSPEKDLICSRDEAGLQVLDGRGNARRLSGLPRPGTGTVVDWVWARDSSGVFAALAGTRDITLWWCPLTAQAQRLGPLPLTFGGFLGVSAKGPIFRNSRGGGAGRMAPDGSAPGENWARPNDDPLSLSPDGRYVFWLSDGLILTCPDDPDRDMAAPLPTGYRLIPPELWPGTEQLLAVYAQGSDPSDCLLLVYSVEENGLSLAGSFEPPSPALAFDTSIDPVVVGAQSVSVVVVDKAAHQKGLKATPGTWVVQFDRTGGS